MDWDGYTTIDDIKVCGQFTTSKTIIKSTNLDKKIYCALKTSDQIIKKISEYPYALDLIQNYDIALVGEFLSRIIMGEEFIPKMDLYVLDAVCNDYNRKCLRIINNMLDINKLYIKQNKQTHIINSIYYAGGTITVYTKMIVININITNYDDYVDIIDDMPAGPNNVLYAGDKVIIANNSVCAYKYGCVPYTFGDLNFCEYIYRGFCGIFNYDNRERCGLTGKNIYPNCGTLLLQDNVLDIQGIANKIVYVYVDDNSQSICKDFSRDNPAACLTKHLNCATIRNHRSIGEYMWWRNLYNTYYIADVHNPVQLSSFKHIIYRVNKPHHFAKVSGISQGFDYVEDISAAAQQQKKLTDILPL